MVSEIVVIVGELAKAAVTVNVVATEPEVTVAVTMPLEPVTAEVGDKVNPAVVGFRVKLTVAFGNGLP